jgi:hypothetical protein
MFNSEYIVKPHLILYVRYRKHYTDCKGSDGYWYIDGQKQPDKVED